MPAVKADEFEDIVKIGRTHLMDEALTRPRICGYVSMLSADIHRIEAMTIY